MAEKPSVEQLEAELKDLKFKVKLIRTATRRSGEVADLENLTALLPQVETLIDLNIRRARKVRLDRSGEASEKIESAIEKNLRKLHLDEKTGKFRGAILHREWTESRMRRRVASQEEQKANHDALYEEVSRIRRVLEAIELHFHSVLTRDLPAPIVQMNPNAGATHKGRKPGVWSQALGACVNSLGLEVEYQTAAAWLDWNKSQVAHEFAIKHGASIAKNSKPVLQPTLRTNKEARKQFHKDLNAAKRRIRGKKKTT